MTHDDLITQNRAKFSKNRVVYVTPSGNHTAHDIDNIDELVAQLKEAKFEARTTINRGTYFTTDWFKHGEDDWWESYVITTVRSGK